MNRKLFNIGICVLLFLGQQSLSYGQIRKEKKANKQFERYAYTDAIHIYKEIVESGKANSVTYAKLGDAYYFNANLTEAYSWYDKYFEHLKDTKPEGVYYFRYAQTLKAVGQTNKADDILKQWAKEFLTEEEANHYLQDFKQNSETNNKVKLTLEAYNSNHIDYGAVDLEDKIVFTSSRNSTLVEKQIDPWTNEPYTGIYQVSKKNIEDVQSLTLEGELATVNYSTPVFSKDGTTMFFTANNVSKKGKKRFNKEDSSLLKIFKATKIKEGVWGQVEELFINSDNFNTAHPSLSNDEKYLYFSSDRPGGYGQSDLYKIELVNLVPKGSVVNLGSEINTSGRESYPFIDENVLYFSSDAGLGYGGLDIFKVNVSDNQGSEAKKVINLGSQFNSAFDDFAYAPKGKNRGYLSSNRPSDLGLDNIYSFSTCSTQLKGNIKDEKTLSGLSESTIEVFNQQKEKVLELKADQQGEYYSEELLCDKEYSIVVKSAGYQSQTIGLTFDFDNLVKQQDFTLKLIEQPKKNLVFEPIYFSYNKIIIREDARLILLDIKGILESNPEVNVEIQSHSDSRGSHSYNMLLSEKRAKETAQWLIQNGIDSNRIKIKALGETMLANECGNQVKCTETQHEKNRRCEFKIIEK